MDFTRLISLMVMSLFLTYWLFFLSLLLYFILWIGYFCVVSFDDVILTLAVLLVLTQLIVFLFYLLFKKYVK
jgi:hypothetical protein